MFEIDFTFRLKPIEWNDYGFNTHYLLFYKTTDSDRFNKIGRILVIDPIKAAEKKEDKPYYNDIEDGVPFESLPSNFISLGASEDYYLTIYDLNQTYPGIKEAIKQNLGDVVMNNKIDKYSKMDFFGITFARNNSVYNIENVYSRILEVGNRKKEYKLAFKFDKPAGKIDIDTSINKLYFNNVYAVIGNNGTGKTRLLEEFIKKLRSKDFKSKTSDLSLEKSQDINQILLITMSALDDHSDIIEKYNVNYIGVVDYTKESVFKKPEILLGEIYDYYRKISIDDSKKYDLEYVLNEYISNFDPFLENFINNKIIPSIDSIDTKDNESEIDSGIFTALLLDDFKELSSGQTNIIYMVFSLIAEVEEDMFAVIDEPELYLHPPYVMGYINLVSYIFDKRNAIAFISTHSPIIIQQIYSDCVYELVKDLNDFSIIKKLSFPCYGESISLITDRIFNVNMSESGFYKELKEKDPKYLKKIYNGDIGLEAKIFIKSLLKKEEYQYDD